MLRRRPRSTRTDTLLPDTTLFRSGIERWLHANGRRRTCATGSNTEDQPMAENKLVEARTVGIVGARGHTGAELIRLIAGHPRFELVLRSDERRVGKECVSTCRSRWSPYH